MPSVLKPITSPLSVSAIGRASADAAGTAPRITTQIAATPSQRLEVSLRSIPLSVFWLFFMADSSIRISRRKGEAEVANFVLDPQNGWQHMPNQYSRQCENKFM